LAHSSSGRSPGHPLDKIRKTKSGVHITYIHNLGSWVFLQFRFTHCWAGRQAGRQVWKMINQPRVLNAGRTKVLASFLFTFVCP